MKVTFLTECNAEIGFGHITRIFSIAYEYKIQGNSVELIVDGDEKLVKSFNQSFKIVFMDWIKSDIELLKIKIKKSDFIVIDSYSMSYSLFRRITLNKKFLFIDDVHRWKHDRGIIVDWTVGVESKYMISNKSADYLVGSIYTPLETNFWKNSKKLFEYLKKIMITFGGGDIRNMSPKIISLIQEKYPNYELNVVIGKSYKNVSEIESITSNYHSLHYYPDANKIKNIMLDSDVAIASGGQTLYELAMAWIAYYCYCTS